MSIKKTMRLILVSSFLVSYQSDSASLFALAKQRSRRGHHSMHQLIYEPLAACYKELVIREGTRRLHAMQCSIKRGPKAKTR